MANDLRGETEIKLGERALKARVNWNAIREFETASGVRWNALVFRLRANDIGYIEIAHLVYACCRAGDKAFKDDFDSFADQIVAEGFSVAQALALELTALGSVPRKAAESLKEADGSDKKPDPSTGTS